MNLKAIYNTYEGSLRGWGPFLQVACGIFCAVNLFYGGQFASSVSWYYHDDQSHWYLKLLR